MRVLGVLSSGTNGFVTPKCVRASVYAGSARAHLFVEVCLVLLLPGLVVPVLLVDLFEKTPKAVREFWARTKAAVRSGERAEFKARVLLPKPPSPVRPTK